MRSPRTKLLSGWLAAALIVATPAGCKKDPPADPAATSDTKQDGSASDAKAEPDPTAVPAAPVPKIEAPPIEAAPKYPTELASLLELVPADEEAFVAFRDPSRVVPALRALSGIPPEALSALLQGFGLSEGQSALVADALVGVGSTLESMPVQLDRGVLVLPEMGEGAVVYASSEPDAVTKALNASANKDGALRCGRVSGVEGFVSCGPADDDPTFVAGEQAKRLSERVAAGLVGIDVDRAFVAGRVRFSKGTVLSMSIEPSGGQTVVSITLPPQIMGARQLGPRAPDMLGMMGVGQGFMWGSLSEEGRKRLTRKAPPVAAGPAGSLSGEFVLGTAGDPPGVVLALGVGDPEPLRSAMALAKGKLEGIPPTLPDGSKVTVEARQLSGKAGPVETLYGSIEGNEALAPLADLGLEPEGYLFVAERFAAVHVGGAKETVEALAAYPGGGPSEELLAMLPPAALADLADERVSILAHVPLDGLSTDAFRSQVKEVAGNVGKGAKVSAERFLEGLLGTLAPMSSFTMWVRHEGKSTALRIAIQPFAAAQTEEGEKAAQAVSAFLSGKSGQEVFGALASEFPDSDRSLAYQIRAGQQPTRAMSSTFMAIVIAATLGYGALAPSQPTVAPSPAPAPPKK